MGNFDEPGNFDELPDDGQTKFFEGWLRKKERLEAAIADVPDAPLIRIAQAMEALQDMEAPADPTNSRAKALAVISLTIHNADLMAEQRRAEAGDDPAPSDLPRA